MSGPPQIRRSGPPPQEAAAANHTNAAQFTAYRPEDGYAAPGAEDRREAALLAELKALGYGITVPCLLCRRPLTSQRSLAARVGPVCAVRMVATG